MGFDPKKVEAALKQDAINIIKAGYNLRGQSPQTLLARSMNCHNEC